jgi:ribosomal protein L11 methyltransferase
VDVVAASLPVPSLDQDRVVAAWGDASPVTGFLQQDDAIVAYVPAPQWTAALRQKMEAWLADRGYAPEIDVRVEPDRNWNAEWEKAIEPVRVGPFYIRPTWADVPDEHADATVLTIDPKMSFGTAHHATTQLMLQLMAEVVPAGHWTDGRVLDVGTGTGILAVAAARLGAASVTGVDVEARAIDNASENATVNDVADRLSLHHGSIEAAPDGATYDVLLGNIHRKVLLDMMPQIADRLRPGGMAMLSGLFPSHQEEMTAAAAEHGLAWVDGATANGWWAGTWQLAE